MSAGAPWSVKGIDPKAREVAKDLARRSGMTLGEWLNRVILEDDIPEDVTHEAQFGGRRPADWGGVRALASSTAGPESARVAQALERLAERIETSETRTGLAIAGVEHSVRHALARVDTAEREHLVVSARLDSALDGASAEHERLAERLASLEAGPRSPEALRLLEGRGEGVEPETMVEAVLERLGERLAQAEARTTQALDELKGSLGGLDRRLVSVERATGEGSFEGLADNLSRRVEAVRAEVAQRLQAASVGQVEAKLAEMSGHVRAAERRATRAVEQLGHQVLNMADAVGRRLDDVDQRSADAIDQVGAEVARVAGAVEKRLARSEHAQAEAFARLRAEVSRVTEALAEGPLALPPVRADAEGPAPAAIFPFVAEAAPGPAAWLNVPSPSPEPAAAGDAPPGVVGADPDELLLGPPPEPEPEPPPAEASAAFGPELFSRAESQAPAAEAETVDAPWRRLDTEPAAQAPSEPFAPLREDDDLFEPAEPRPGAAPELSTREVIARARAAARAAQASSSPDIRAKVGARRVTGRLFSGFNPKPGRQTTALQTALMVAGGAAFLSVGAAGLTLLQGSDDKPPATSDAPFGQTPRAAVALSPGGFNPTAPDAAVVAAPVFDQVRAEVEAGAPGAVARLKALAEADHPQAQLYLAQLYDGGGAGLVRDLPEARRLTALAADHGEPQAMHNLGVYLFRGEGGPQDLTKAAEWFRKAADAGVVESQYNLGLLYQSGSGVGRDLSEARRWFGLAASKGDLQASRALAQLEQPGAAAARR